MTPASVRRIWWCEEVRSKSRVGIVTELWPLADCLDFSIHRFFGAATTPEEFVESRRVNNAQKLQGSAAKLCLCRIV